MRTGTHARDGEDGISRLLDPLAHWLRVALGEAVEKDCENRDSNTRLSAGYTVSRLHNGARVLILNCALAMKRFMITNDPTITHAT